jgi:hypothetical protein
MIWQDLPRNTRFSINFFTSIGLGGLTDDLRAYLKNMPKMIMQQQKEVSDSDDDSSDSDSSDSDSSDSRYEGFCYFTHGTWEGLSTFTAILAMPHPPTTGLGSMVLLCSLR